MLEIKDDDLFMFLSCMKLGIVKINKVDLSVEYCSEKAKDILRGSSLMSEVLEEYSFEAFKQDIDALEPRECSYLTKENKLLRCVINSNKFSAYMYIIELCNDNNRLENIMSILSDAIVETKIDGQVLYVSDKFKNRFGGIKVLGSNIFDTLEDIVAEDQYDAVYDIREFIENGGTNCNMELKLRGNRGDYLWYQLVLQVIDNIIYIIIKNINTDRKLRNELYNKANIDGLTGLHNKISGTDKIRNMMNHAVSSGYLLFFDVDNFKGVNDTYGHLTGDEVLKFVSKAMRAYFKRDKDILCRFGGDEFCIFVGSSMSEECLGLKLRGMQEKVKEYCSGLIDDRAITITIGAYKYSKSNNQDFDSIMECADKLLYEAKEKGKNRYLIG